MQQIEHTIPVDVDSQGTRFDQFLAAKIPELSRARAQALIHAGRATVDGHEAKPSHKVREGESIRVIIEPLEPLSLEAEDIRLDIVFEDEHIIVIDKAAGMVVHPATGTKSGTLVNALLGHSGKLPEAGGANRPGIVVIRS